MPSEHPHVPYVPFDERAALEELERLHHAVEESRRRRKDASAAFDEFVSSFHKEPGRDVQAARPAVESRKLSRLMDAPPLAQGPPAAARKPLPKAGVIAGAVVAVAAGLLLTRVWRSSPVERSTAPASVSTSAPAGSAASAATASATPATGDGVTGGLQAELTALRRVWVRATVDGTRVVERELQPDERVPLRGGRTLVIRAGDAGAVRVTIDGQDRGPVGADGIALTRTYTASSQTGR